MQGVLHGGEYSASVYSMVVSSASVYSMVVSSASVYLDGVDGSLKCFQ